MYCRTATPGGIESEDGERKFTLPQVEAPHLSASPAEIDEARKRLLTAADYCIFRLRINHYLLFLMESIMLSNQMKKTRLRVLLFTVLVFLLSSVLEQLNGLGNSPEDALINLYNSEFHKFTNPRETIVRWPDSKEIYLRNR